VETVWTGAVCLLGGDQEVAAAAAADLGARYAESHRRYHDIVHVRAVVQDVTVLAAELRLPAEERAVLTIAAGAHDVVYNGRPDDDERRSASWARDWLARAGVGEAHVTRAGDLVLATAAHSASPDDLAAAHIRSLRVLPVRLGALAWRWMGLASRPGELPAGLSGGRSGWRDTDYRLAMPARI
jgi:predicted metal-dependent HD superfamily phosphohydrolase